MKFEKEQEKVSSWLLENEIIFKNQQLLSTLEEKEQQLNEFKEKSKLLAEKEKSIDSFVDIGHSLLQTCEVDVVKTVISQISNRYLCREFNITITTILMRLGDVIFLV